MKKLRWILLFLLLPFFSNAGQVSGYISLKWVQGYTYQIMVTDYTNGDPQNSGYCDPYDVDTLRLYIVDNGLTSVLLTRNNGTGDSVCSCRKVNTYQTTYTFSGPGSYRIWFDAGSRVPNINNIPNSSFQDMEIYNTLLIQAITQGDSTFPVITHPPVCSYGCPTQCYHFNLHAYSPAGDSLSYSLGSCLPGTGYFNPGATINDSGTLKWCPSPKDTGLWNFAILITTYKNTIVLGNHVYVPLDTEEVELQVDVETDCTLGVNEVKSESEKVSVYPNPGNGIFQLEIKNYKSEINNEIEVYNALGQQVYSATFLIFNSSFLINLSNQPNGIYFYRVLNEDGGLIGDGKLMVEH